jgi:hypothetical protein
MKLQQQKKNTCRLGNATHVLLLNFMFLPYPGLRLEFLAAAAAATAAKPPAGLTGFVTGPLKFLVAAAAATAAESEPQSGVRFLHRTGTN